MVIGSRQRLATFDDHDINVFVNNKQIEKVKSTKSLGLSIDKNLAWKKHIDDISKKVSSGISALKRIRSYVNNNTAVRVYQGLIEPYFSYCAPVWDGIGSKLSDKLQKLQNRAARVITCSSYDTFSSSFSYSGASLWNSLPEDLRFSESLSSFKRSLSINCNSI